MVRGGSRIQQLDQLIRQLLHFGMHRIVIVRCRAAHYVALHIAAGRQGRELDFIDPPNRFMQVTFQHAVQLQSLPTGNPQRAAAKFIAQIEFAQQLIGR